MFGWMVPTCGCCSLAIQTGLARGCIVGLVDDTAQLPFVRIAAAVEFAPGSLALAAGSCTRRSRSDRSRGFAAERAEARQRRGILGRRRCAASPAPPVGRATAAASPD